MKDAEQISTRVLKQLKDKPISAWPKRFRSSKYFPRLQAGTSAPTMPRAGRV